MSTPVHGYKFRILGTTIEVTLVTKGDGQGLRVKKGGTIYDVYLVQTTDPKATTIKVKHPTLGIMALREYAAFMIQKLLEETLTLTDFIYQKFIRTASDGIGFVDSVIKFLGGIVSLEETLTLIDSFTGRMWGTLTDALNLADETFKKYITPIAEGFNFADAVGGLLSSIKTETLTLVDSVAKKVGKVVIETLSLADEAFKKYVLVPVDSFSFTDAVAGFLTSVKTETLSLADSSLKKFGVLLPPPAPTQGLVAEWLMDEGGGNTVYDTSGGENDGTIYGDPQWVLGISGWALDFDGEEDFVDIGTVNFVTGAHSVIFWTYSSEESYVPLFELKLDSLGFLSYKDNLGRVMCGHRGNVQPYTDSGTFPLNQYNQIALIYNGGDKKLSSSYKIYINTVEKTTTTPFGSIGSSFERNYIGRERNMYGDAITNKFRVYEGILSQEQINQLYRRGRTKDSLRLKDSFLRGFGAFTSDMFGFTDATLRSFGKIVEEGLSLSDQIFIGPLRKILTETLSLADAFTGAMSGLKTETLSLADTITRLFTRPASDSFNFGDTVNGFLFTIKTEALSLGDTLSRKFKKILSDGLALNDAILRRLSGVATDAFSFADSTVRSFQKDIGDSLSLADEIFIGPLRKILGESLNLSDAFTGFMAGVKTEVLTLADTLAQAFGTLATDGFSFGDSITGFLATTKAETLSLADSSLKKFRVLLPPPIPTGGLVAEYDMDEGEGGTIYDTSGQGNHGIIYGAKWVLGLVGWALGFDGDNDYVNLGTTLLNNPDAGTVCFWLFPTANGESGAKPYWNTTILNKGWCYEAIQQLSDNKIRIYFYNGIGWAWLDSINSLTLNQWNCVIYAWDASGSTIYIAGLPDVVSETKTWADYHAGHLDQPLHLGGYTVETLPYYFEGSIDKGRFYTRRFSDEEAAQLTRRGLTRDSLRLGDSFLKGFGAIASDMFGFIDSVTGYFKWTLTEGLTLADQIVQKKFRETLADGLSLADQISKKFGTLKKYASDSFGFTDATTRAFGKIMAEGLALADEIFINLGEFIKYASDSIGFQDSVARTEYAYFGTFKFGEMKFGYEHPS